MFGRASLHPTPQNSTSWRPTGKGIAYAVVSKIHISTGNLSSLAVELVYKYGKVKRPQLLVKSLSLYWPLGEKGVVGTVLFQPKDSPPMLCFSPSEELWYNRMCVGAIRQTYLACWSKRGMTQTKNPKQNPFLGKKKIRICYLNR